MLQSALQQKSIVVLYENDVHCAIDGYARLAGMREALALGDSLAVALVSCGDYLQGGVAGSISKGQYIVDILRHMNYDAIGLGNHDFYRKNPEHKSIFSSKRHWFPGTNIGYINAVNAIDNVQLLNNEAYEDDKVYIFGFTQAPEYFQFNRDEKHSSSIFHPGNEDLDIMLSDLDSLDQKLINNLPKHKAKIAIIHSPVFLTDSQVAAKLYEFDYFISGHMHNGVIPPIINDFWHSDRGFIAPGKKLFPRNARAKITNPSDKIITLGAVSTIQDSAKPITFMNGLFPINIATLELTKNESLARKPDINHQYFGY